MEEELERQVSLSKDRAGEVEKGNGIGRQRFFRERVVAGLRR